MKSAFPSSANTKSNDLLNSSLWGDNVGQRSWLDLYNENPRLSVVHKISEDNGSTPYSIKTKNRRGSYFVDNHPLDVEIRKHSVPQFFSLWTAYRLMTGMVYIAFDMEGGMPTNFKIFTKIHLVSAQDDSFEFRYGSTTIKYPKNQVIVDTDLDLNSPYTKGKGKAEAIKDEIETDEYVQKYIKYFYINSARPDVFITAEAGEDMSREDVERLESEWYRKFQGVVNAHKPVFLNWAANIVSVPTNHKDMELLDTRRFYRDTTIQHFGVPPEIMGIVENSNKATVIAAEHIYAKQVRLPILEHIELIVNTKIMPLFGDSQPSTFHFENIIPDDVELTLKIVGEASKYGTITYNEWRTALGYPKLEGDIGDQLIPTRIISGIQVDIEDETIPVRDFKEVVAENFIDKASTVFGRPVDNEIQIIRDEEENREQEN